MSDLSSLARFAPLVDRFQTEHIVVYETANKHRDAAQQCRRPSSSAEEEENAGRRQVVAESHEARLYATAEPAAARAGQAEAVAAAVQYHSAASHALVGRGRLPVLGKRDHCHPHRQKPPAGPTGSDAA